MFVLTHGDGSARDSRLASTTRVLERAGARIGPVYGRWRDGDLYRALLDGQHEEFFAVVDCIGDAIVAQGIDCVVADAEERYNPSHDVCRYLATSVCRMLSRSGHHARDLEFPLVGEPAALMREASATDPGIVVHLDELALARKLEAARAYPEMAGEVARALETFGDAAFSTECLTPARTSPLDATTRPHYEAYGEAQVAAGKYRDVITYDRHVRPLRERLAALERESAGA